MWQYALAAYQRPQVAELCLTLQDRFAADVNLLLTAGWLATRHVVWRPAEVAGLIDSCALWRQHCLLPLRSVRRYLREHMDGDEALAELYQQGKALELEAERYQLSLIEGVINTSLLGWRSGAHSDWLAANLDAYLDLLIVDSSLYRRERDALLVALSDA